VRNFFRKIIKNDRSDDHLPGDDDIIAQIAELMAKGKAVPPPLEEASLRIHLKTYPERANLLLRLCTILGEQGKPISLELEERTLRALLTEDPERKDLQERLESVQAGLGKSNSRQRVTGADGAMASQTDVDFQTDAASYERQADYRDLDEAFTPLRELASRFTMTSVERMYALYKAVEYIEAAQVPGSFVECGVWRGGSIMLALATLVRMGCTNRDIYLFDTFEGLPRPDISRDVDIFGNRAIDGWLPNARGQEESNWAYASLDDVRANVSSVGYPSDRIHFIKGMVENTLPGRAPEQIALLRLDTDWYSSTKHEMVHLYPRLEAGGVLIIDDYGHFLGARQAIDEYVAEHGLSLLLNRIDYAGRLAVKLR